jgi:hypothetical protein
MLGDLAPDGGAVPVDGNAIDETMQDAAKVVKVLAGQLRAQIGGEDLELVRGEVQGNFGGLTGEAGLLAEEVRLLDFELAQFVGEGPAGAGVCYGGGDFVDAPADVGQARLECGDLLLDGGGLASLTVEDHGLDGGEVGGSQDVMQGSEHGRFEGVAQDGFEIAFAPAGGCRTGIAIVRVFGLRGHGGAT